MTPARAEKWKETRAKGKTRYVFLVGVLWWGGFMTGFMSIWQYFMRPERYDWIQDPLANLLVFTIGGFLFGTCIWSIAEKQYLKFTKGNWEIEPAGWAKAQNAPGTPGTLGKQTMNPWLFVALVAIIAIAAVIAYDRLLAPKLLQRRVNKLIANAGNSDPRVLENAKNGTISCDSEFLTISTKNETQKIAWRDIEEIDAYKIDLFSVDLICIAILSHSAKIGLEINEEMAGYRDA